MMKTTAVRHTFIMLLVLAIQSAQCHQHKYNVVNFHAAADGKTDDSQVTAANAKKFLKVATTPKKIALLLVFLISLSVVFAAKKAFLATWQAACSDQARPIMVIPRRRTFLLSEVTFQGPCKSPITIQVTTIPRLSSCIHMFCTQQTRSTGSEPVVCSWMAML